MPLRLLLISFMLLQLICRPVYAESWGFSESDFDEEQKPWEELQAQLPAYPDMAKALHFEVSPAIRTQFFVDPKSISVGADDVVRYTLIARSPSGVLNVSYEGIRCATNEKKLYAFGRKDGTWSRNRYAKWGDISATRDPQQYMLSSDFFCPLSIIVRDPDEAISALQNGINPRAQR